MYKYYMQSLLYINEKDQFSKIYSISLNLDNKQKLLIKIFYILKML